MMSITLEVVLGASFLESKGIKMFVVGESYDRAKDIHDQFGGARQSGI